MKRARPRNPRAPTIDILIASPRWKAKRQAPAILRKAVRAAAAVVSTSAGELAIVLTDDSNIRALNRAWRGKDEPTNVLSFPVPKRTGALLGDIVIAYETLAREARAERKPFDHHLAHLAVHGYLHLVGFDHEDEDEAAATEGLETAILARLKVPDPYIARARKD
jgi:probable rRNA maturation factor